MSTRLLRDKYTCGGPDDTSSLTVYIQISVGGGLQLPLFPSLGRTNAGGAVVATCLFSPVVRGIEVESVKIAGVYNMSYEKIVVSYKLSVRTVHRKKRTALPLSKLTSVAE